MRRRLTIDLALDRKQLIGAHDRRDRDRHFAQARQFEDLATAERALVAGATSFILKPLNWNAFGEHIRHMLHLSCAARVDNTPTPETCAAVESAR